MATIAALYLYPIKSCAGIALREATLGAAGLESQGAADRGWMVVDEAGVFRTQRQLQRMATITTALTGDALVLSAPRMPSLLIPLQSDRRSSQSSKVRVWNDECLARDEGDEAAQWLSDMLRTAVRLVRFDDAQPRLASRQWTGDVTAQARFADGFPMLVIAQSSLDDLNRRLQEAGRPALPMDRFRPNLVLADLGAYDEDRLLALSSDGIHLRPVKPCPRCAIPSIDQATGKPGANPLDILGQYRHEPRTGGVVFGQNVIPIAGVGRTLRVGETLAEEWNF